jgi:V/A-type H+-transporting ATPase subunit I
MSIATFKKITVLGLNNSKAEILNALQELGCVHVISTKFASKSALTTVSTTLLDQIKIALRYLKDSPEQARPRLTWKEFNPDQVVKDILTNQKLLRDGIDRRDWLTTRIKERSEWGNFLLPIEGDLQDIKLWFYKIKIKEISWIPKNLPLLEVYRNNRYVFIVVMSRDEPQEEHLIINRVHTGSLSIDSLQNELYELNQTIDDLLDGRRNLTRYRYLLSLEVAQFADRTQLKKAMEQTQEDDHFFLLQGWVPASHLGQMKQFCQDQQVGMTIEPPLQDELPPTLLKSPSWLAGGEELVNFYQTPGYHALDPSIMVFFSFAMFFAMIMADAGYGMVLALFTLVGWRKIGKYNGAKFLRPILVTCSAFSILYGILLGSYWGVEPKAGTLLAQFKIININDFKSMMILVLIVGCLHISIASGMRAWHARIFNEKIQAIGFIILIIAALFLAVGLMHNHPQIHHFSILLFIIGLFMIMVFASSEPVTNINSLLKRCFHGIAAVTELPSLFGDILSYLRLFALGLAGASLAITFNTIALHVAQSKGWLLAGVVLILGQTMNFALCLMGAVIHGLRLNYIEFFKWSIKEEGYGYQPLTKRETPHE